MGIQTGGFAAKLIELLPEARALDAAVAADRALGGAFEAFGKAIEVAEGSGASYRAAQGVADARAAAQIIGRVVADTNEPAHAGHAAIKQIRDKASMATQSFDDVADRWSRLPPRLDIGASDDLVSAQGALERASWAAASATEQIGTGLEEALRTIGREARYFPLG